MVGSGEIQGMTGATYTVSKKRQGNKYCFDITVKIQTGLPLKKSKYFYNKVSIDLPNSVTLILHAVKEK